MCSKLELDHCDIAANVFLGRAGECQESGIDSYLPIPIRGDF